MNYKHLFTPLGIIAHWCFPCDAFGVGTAIAGIANMIGTANANSQNVRMQEEINQRNISNQWKMFHAQNARQDYLNRNQDLIKRQSLVGAGLNVNSEFGGYPNLATNSIPLAEQKAAQVQPIDASVFAQLLQQAPLVNAQARQANADAKAQEIENARQETLDRHLDAYFKDKFPAFDDANAVGSYKDYNKGTIDAQKLEREWEVRATELDALDVQYQFEKLVNDKKLADSATIQAVADMPLLERRKLYNEVLNLIKDRKVMDSVIKLNDAHTSLAASQEALNLLEEEITRNSNIHELITKYLGDSAMADAAHFITMLVGAVTGNMRFGANLSKFSGKTRSTNTNSNTNRNTSTSRVHVYKHEE